MLFEGESNRNISEHKLNKHSSRAHSVFTIHLEMRSKVESSEKVVISKLNIVDLAGSERLSKNNIYEESLRKESISINLSLNSLSNVLNSISRKENHIP